MYDIAAQVQGWLDEQRPARVAQVVATRGFSSREPGSGLAWTDGVAAGALFPGVDADLTSSEDGLVEVTISQREAVAAGLACGGVATVLVQPAGAFPADTWTRLMRREPLCLLTEIAGDDTAQTRLYTPANVRDAAQRPRAEDVARLFERGTSATALVQGDEAITAVVTLWPPTSLLVVGDGTIATALAGAAGLLGWTPVITSNASAAAAALTESDAIVVLSHDRAVDGPALAAALSGRAGYVGALGSRATQDARREWLTANGVSTESQHRIHGPAGLDIDAHTPGEIAVSIVAEILANRSGTSGGSIRDRRGPVHTAGVRSVE